MIVLAQITNTEIFAFRADPDPSWLQKKKKKKKFAYPKHFVDLCGNTQARELLVSTDVAGLTFYESVSQICQTIHELLDCV